ncbi:MAG: Slp family lipoprotein [Desulfuromonadaceae bacterium]
MKSRLLLLAGLMVALLFSGCAPVISNEAKLAVDPLLDFSQDKQNPNAYLGKTLLLGGLLVDVRVHREGTELEIIQYTLGRWDRPLDPDPAGGRFLARTERFLDPELFLPGLQVTLTGQVVGEEVRPLRGTDFPYPVFTIGEIHLWQSSTRSNPYPPYYYPTSPWPPYYDPFWPGYNPYWYDRSLLRRR